MDKPQKYKIEYYDLLNVLHYIDSKVPNFKEEIWYRICDEDYIKNDTITIDPIEFQKFSDEDNETIKKGINVLFEEFPDIKNEEIHFQIYW